VHRGLEAERCLPAWVALRRECNLLGPGWRHEWLAVLRKGLKHQVYCLEAHRDDEVLGILPLSFVRSPLFGRFLVGLPYLNVGGVMTQDALAAEKLVDAAVALADDLDVRYLELRQETATEHPALGAAMTKKVHMRLDLPDTPDALWDQFKPKLRSQIRKGEKNGLSVHWGRDDMLDEFYRVFAVNMRDLGTPVFSKRLFAAILEEFGDDAEFCIVRKANESVAAGVLVHGEKVTEVPSASSLRQYNALSGNMLMYWHLLKHSIERGQQMFDFGRSSKGSGTYRFKEQWGAEPHPAVWQYYVRRGSIDDMRPDDPGKQRLISLWKKMPVWATRIVGPPIVRGIP
jgi:FemAB-related protein (PEP-CTERM system-associated)